MNQSLSKRVSELVGQKTQLQKILKEKESSLIKLEKRQVSIEKAQVLLQTTAQETQNGLKIHLEDIVQMALDTCYPGEYEFKADFELKRGSTVCEMYLEDDTGFKVNPMTAAGGGVVDIISLALRLATWTLSKPDNLLVLDEPFKFLSEGLQPLAGEILQQMSRKLNLQIIMITHNPVMVDIADKVFQVKKHKKKYSKVKEV